MKTKSSFECDECCANCHPHEDEQDYAQWQENGLCRQCNDNGFSIESGELRSLVNIGF